MRYSKIGLTCAVLIGAGCVQQPHNNVLLFGTDTKVALDVSSSATSGGAPQITLGYRRAEAVWMPLVVNEQVCNDAGECQTVTAQTNGEPLVLEGEDFRTNGGRDSYSVFASFGAKFSGDATAGGAKADGGLAQFFATGIAAQRLASNPGVEQVLKVNNPQAAAAEANAAQKQSDAAATTAASDAKLGEERVKAVEEAITLDQARLSHLKECLPNDAAKRSTFQAKIPAADVARNSDLDAATVATLTSEATITSWWRTLTTSDKTAVMAAQTGICA